MAKSNAKKKAWTAFSKYIRVRDCLETTGSPYYGVCCTCGKQYPIERLQAGHFVAGRTNALLFRETGVHGQCVSCNMFKGGAWVEYEEFMLERYGPEITLEEKMAKRKTVSYSEKDYQDIAKEYQRKTKELLNGS